LFQEAVAAARAKFCPVAKLFCRAVKFGVKGRQYNFVSVFARQKLNTDTTAHTEYYVSVQKLGLKIVYEFVIALAFKVYHRHAEFFAVFRSVRFKYASDGKGFLLAPRHTYRYAGSARGNHDLFKTAKGFDDLIYGLLFGYYQIFSSSTLRIFSFITLPIACDTFITSTRLFFNPALRNNSAARSDCLHARLSPSMWRQASSTQQATITVL
jgi:hypothetical protein